MTLGPWRGGLGGVKTPLKHDSKRLTPLGAADCRRRATPPHPRDTGHLKQGDGKREIGRLPRHRRLNLQNITKTASKISEISRLRRRWRTKMAPKIDSKSMKHRGCVFRAFWVTLGREDATNGVRDSSVWDHLWRPFSDQNRKWRCQKVTLFWT